MTLRTNNLALLAGLGIGAMVMLSGTAQGQDKPKWNRITGIDVETQGAVTRVVVQVSGVIDIKGDRLENPPRIFVDFAETIPALPGPKQGSMWAVEGKGDLLKQVRIAENQRGVTRLVFDLTRADIDSQTIALKSPDRLVVELRVRPSDGRMKNPLAAPLVSERSVPRKAELRAAARPVNKSSYVMVDPPLLPASFRLPKAESNQLPYRVSGFVLQDFVPKRPPTAVTRQADQAAMPAVAASRMSAGRQSLTRVLGLKIGKVVIDPGHGGHDAGSTGATGLVEKEVTLDIAKRLATLLETNLGSEVVLTRKDDEYISPEQRTAIANQHHADLFISIHANASRLQSATGVETYYLNFTSSPEALEVAARENASSQRSVADLGDLIKKIALKDKIDESREFAGKVQRALYSGSIKAGNRTKDRGVRKAPFIVLIGAEMPCVLTEVGFLSNPKEESLLRRGEYRQKLAEALYRGVAQYAGSLSHFNMAQVEEGAN